VTVEREADKEAVMVYAIEAAIRPTVKGGTDRGRSAAAEVLKGLDRETVAQRIRQLWQDSGTMRDDIEWMGKHLSIAPGDYQK
jgi:hypothetical protein